MTYAMGHQGADDLGSLIERNLQHDAELFGEECGDRRGLVLALVLVA